MEVKIEKLDHFGRGITKINNKICFVEDALPEEIVEIKVTKEKKNYLLAEVVEIKKKSKDRITPICPYTKKCGGCNLAHMTFQKENEFKEMKVIEIMQKFADIEKEKIKEIVYDEPYHYRNKITLHEKDGMIGLFAKKSNDIISIENCLLVEDKLNDQIKKLAPSKNQEIVLKIGNKTKEILNSKDQKKYIISIIGDKKYKISKESFFQVNSKITEKLYEEVKAIVTEKNIKKVLDLYAGTGTIGIYVSDMVEKVLGIESCKEAVIDAIDNIKLNHKTNCRYILGKVEDLTKEITKEYDLAIIDPPRAGLKEKVVEKLLEITPKTLIYIACDPITLARDLKKLQRKYNVSYIRPYNMFPRTYHVECVCLLKLR